MTKRGFKLFIIEKQPVFNDILDAECDEIVHGLCFI